MFESDVEFPERLHRYFKFYRFSKELPSYALKYLFTFCLKQGETESKQETGESIPICY